MITKDQLERFHQAAKMIETDGVEAYHSISRRFGSDIAAALIIAFVRRNHGSMDTWPAREDIVPRTNRVLSFHRLLK